MNNQPEEDLLEVLKSAKESYDMIIDDACPLPELAKDVIKGFFVTVDWGVIERIKKDDEF